jgi:hypothetical protein
MTQADTPRPRGKPGRKPKPNAPTNVERAQASRDRKAAYIAQLEATIAAYQALYGALPEPE